MWGGIIGDVIGSRLEYSGLKYDDFELFTPNSNFTDDTVMTIALADAFMNGEDISECYVKWGIKYFHEDFGPSFRKWLSNPYRKPYHSYGNGSAMRVGCIPYLSNSINEAEKMAIKSAMPTHNHVEGVIGACATAVAGRMALERYSKDEIKDVISSRYAYDLNRTIKDIQPEYVYEISCQKSVPESIIAFLESDSYIRSIRNVISLGGDADTMACITGSIAYPFFRQNENSKIWQYVEKRIPKDMRAVIHNFNDVVKNKTYERTEINIYGRQNSYELLWDNNDVFEEESENTNIIDRIKAFFTM